LGGDLIMMATIKRQVKVERNKIKKELRKKLTESFFNYFFLSMAIVGGFMVIYNFVFWGSASIMRLQNFPFDKGDLEFGFFFLWIFFCLPWFSREIRDNFKKILEHLDEELKSI